MRQKARYEATCIQHTLCEEIRERDKFYRKKKKKKFMRAADKEQTTLTARSRGEACKLIAELFYYPCLIDLDNTTWLLL